MYTVKNYPPVPTYTRYHDGTIVSGSAPGGSLTVSRTDTIRRKKPAPLSETSVTTTVTDLRQSNTYWQSPSGDSYAGSTGNLGLFGRPTVGTLYSATQTRCENGLRAKARGSGINIAMMLAEYRQTASLFYELSVQAVNLARAVRCGNFRKAFNTYRRSKDFLRFQYGVRPLMSDMYNAYVELAGSKIPPLRIENSATDRTSYKKSSYYMSLSNPYTASFFAEIRVRAYATVQFNEGFFNSFATQHGLTNPALLALELIPFSFIVDWWVNIGETLESLDNCLVFSSLNGGVSTKIEEVVTIPNVEGYFRYQQKTRAPKSFSLTNGLVYKPSISVQHVLNGLALWRALR